MDDDEKTVRDRLIALIDGPAAAVPQPTAGASSDPVQPQPDEADEPDTQTASRSRDPRRIPPWWTGRHVDLTPDGQDEDEEQEPQAANADAEPTEEPDGADTDAQPKKRRLRLRIPVGPRSPDSGPSNGGPILAAPAPRMSLLDAYARIPPRIRWLVLHSSAAAAGYKLGWVQFSTRTAAWIAQNGLLTASGIFWCGCTIGCEVLRYRAFRGWRLPVRWLAAIPISSIVVGTLLYGTDWTELHLELPL